MYIRNVWENSEVLICMLKSLTQSQRVSMMSRKPALLGGMFQSPWIPHDRFRLRRNTNGGHNDQSDLYTAVKHNTPKHLLCVTTKQEIKHNKVRCHLFWMTLPLCLNVLPFCFSVPQRTDGCVVLVKNKNVHVLFGSMVTPPQPKPSAPIQRVLVYCGALPNAGVGWNTQRHTGSLGMGSNTQTAGRSAQGHRAGNRLGIHRETTKQAVDALEVSLENSGRHFQK